MIRHSSALAAVACLLAACGGGEKASTDTTTPADTPAVAAAGGDGAALYARCVTCHQSTGQGVPGSFPPLVGSEYALAQDPGVPIRIVLHGLTGPVTVKGQTYNSAMIAYGTGQEMTDDEVASVLTYVRTSWGNSASPVTAQQVAEVRSATAGHTGQMTAAELQPLMQ